MLQSLQIENYALIRSLHIDFDRGFTVITGETGAGKSILMGALSLILGHRADTDVLFDKQRKCIVEGTFNISQLQLEPFFEQNDLDYQETTLIRREINEKGKSRAFINDTPVTLITLKELTSALIDIHSQHQNLMLNDSTFRLHIIDQFAQNSKEKTEYQNILKQWREAEQQYQELKQQCTNAALQQEFNQYTVDELSQATLQEDEQETIEQNIRLLSHAEEIKEHLYKSAQQLSENEGDTILQQLKSVQNECSFLTQIGQDYQELYDRLSNAIVEIQDISYEISRKEAEVEVNPQELDRLNERIDLIYTLEKKYQVDSVAALLDLQTELQRKLDEHTDNQERLKEADRQRQDLLQNAQLLASKLSETRRNILPILQQEMVNRLKQLGMSDSQFIVELQQLESLHTEGVDQAHFLFSANQGSNLGEVSRIASGGEMSRIMLALKSIITDSVLLPTVIFDEIDTGISGETAHKVAQVMGLLSQQHQVIAITHLPQIAAKGNQHYEVYKTTDHGQTTTSVRKLNDSERAQAIATMLSGSTITQTAMAAALELIQNSKLEHQQ